MRKKLLSIIAATGIIALSACSGGSSEIVVETKAGDITKDEFYETLKDRYGEQVLQEVVLEKILADKYEVSEEEIEDKLDELREQLGDAIDLQYDKDELNRVAKFQVLQEKAVTKDVSVDEDEVKEFYDNIKPEIEARHILVEDEDEAKKLKKELDDGADFAKLAEENSIDPGSVNDGGNLGIFSKGTMVPEFEEVAFSLEKDEISEPTKTENGWHIIQVTNIVEKKPFDEMKNMLEHKVKLSKVSDEDVLKSFQNEIEDAKIKVKDKKLQDLFAQFGQ